MLHNDLSPIHFGFRNLLARAPSANERGWVNTHTKADGTSNPRDIFPGKNMVHDGENEILDPTSYVMFAFLCLFWGSTWIAIKTGVAAIPPFFYAGTRFLAAGILLFAWLWLVQKTIPIKTTEIGAFLPGALLMIAANYGLMAWGMKVVSSGLSAVINLALIPLSMLIFSSLYAQERIRPNTVLGLMVGVAGLAVLFYPKLADPASKSAVEGMIAIAAGACCYSWGSVLNKQKKIRQSPLVVSAVQTFTGGLVLTVIALIVEPIDAQLWPLFFNPGVFASWLFLVVFGSLLAFTIYLVLLKKWNPTRVANYAFVCPVIALIESAAIEREIVTLAQGAASLLMLGGAWIAMRRPRPIASNA